MSTKSYSATSPTSASPTLKEIKLLKKEVPPGFMLEVVWLTASLFFVKIAVPGAFSALTFVTIFLPLMIYFIINVLQNLLKFVQLLHMEDLYEDSSFLSPN